MITITTASARLRKNSRLGSVLGSALGSRPRPVLRRALAGTLTAAFVTAVTGIALAGAAATPTSAHAAEGGRDDAVQGDSRGGSNHDSVRDEAEANAFFRQRSLTLDLALDLARDVLTACRQRGWSISVAVVDRGGNVQAVLRDSRAGAKTVEAATRKAYTALSYRTSSQEMAELTQATRDPSGMRFVPGSLHVGGGERIWARGENVGAVAAAGAPTPADDVQCVTEGLQEFSIQLDLAS